MRSEAGLLTRGALPHRLPGVSASGDVAGKHLPLQRRDRPGLAPGSLTALRCRGGAYHRTVPADALRLWAPVVGWAALIFAFSSVPDLGTGLGAWDLVLRKLAHAVEFAVLGALLARAFAAPAVAAASGVLYAVSDELHQTLVAGREGSMRDLAIDAAGVLAGVVTWHLLARRRHAG